MNATKRKFNALLQGIGTRSSPSVSSRTADDRSAPAGAAAPSTNTSTVSGSSSARDLEGSSSTIHHGDSHNQSNMLFSSALPSAAGATSELDTITKRRRLGLSLVSSSSPSALRDTSSNAGTASTTGTSATTTISNIVLRKWSGGAHGKEEVTKASLAPPRYCPGDREQLLKRLATFQELTDWTPKPDRVSEIEWAKRGWVCQGKERLRCTLCNKELVVRLNRKEVDGREVPVLVASEIEEALVDRYTDLIVAAHQDDCLWRKKGCDDSLLRVTALVHPRQALEDLRKRYDELCARKDFLPYEFNLRLPEGFDLDADVLKNLPPSFFTEPPPAVLTSSSSPNRAALALAVMGWQGLTNSRIGPVPNSASCQTCLRRLGLWMFKSKQVDLETNTVLEPGPMDHLDPVREHRFFCPWKNGAAQRNPGGGAGSLRARARAGSSREADKPGWAVLVQVLKNDAYLRNRNTGAAAPHNRDSGPFSAPATATERPTTPGGPQQGAGPSVLVDGAAAPAEDDPATRDAKDKERWARLRKVKSLFETKGSKKLRRTQSRPGTGHSTLATPDGGGSGVGSGESGGGGGGGGGSKGQAS